LVDVTLEGELLANQSYQIKEDEMGGACGMHGREKILVGRPMGSDQLEDVGVDRRLFKWLLNTVAYPGDFLGGCGGGGSSTYSVEDRGQRERGSGRGGPLVRGSNQFANE
jgi:hypothetical protein